MEGRLYNAQTAERMQRVVVTGASGQLGRMLVHSLLAQGGQPEGDGIAGWGGVWHFLNREQLDITNQAQTLDTLRTLNPDVVVNCAAYTQVDRAEEEVERAHLVNGQGVRLLLSCTEGLGASGRGSHIVHISTDYVFGGQGNSPHTEEAIPRPQCVYAQSKRAGELALLGNRRAMVLRTGWLYSHFGSNFFRTIAARCLDGKPLRVVYDQVGCPTWAGSLAQAIGHIAAQRLFDSGIYHCTDLGVASWYDFAFAIRQSLGCNNEIVPIRSTEYTQRAKRPSYSVLDGSWSRIKLGYTGTHWLESLSECARLWKECGGHTPPTYRKEERANGLD